MVYATSPFQDSETFLRIVVGLDEDDIQMNLKHNNSNFAIYETPPRIYSIKDV